MTTAGRATASTPWRRTLKLFISVTALYAAWLAMEIVHEGGHVLHAVMSGGRVTRVVLPLIGFSRTDLSVHPHPLFIAWGGPLWGAVLPFLGLAAVAAIRRKKFEGLHWTMQAFAGFCLIANGAYLGVGWIDRVGDAGDIIRRGTSPIVLLIVGAIFVAGGLWIWHRLGDRRNA